MKEFIEKLIGRLEERINLHNKKAQKFANSMLPSIAIDELKLNDEVEEIKKIVNQLAEEYPKTPSPNHPIPIDTQQYIAELERKLKEKDCSKCSRRSWYQKGYADGYTKAIDEFLKLGSEEFKSDSIGYAQLITIAEQLTVSEMPTGWKQSIMERFEKVE